MIYRFYPIIILCLFFGCDSSQEPENDNEILAIVDDKVLRKDDLNSILDITLKDSDSTNYIRAYVESWVRDQMLLVQAKKEYEDNEEIQQLVKQYKESLMLHQFKKDYLESQVQSIVSEEELRTYYNKNKDNFIAEEELYNISFYRFSRLHNLKDEFEELWPDDIENYDNLAAFCSVGNTRCFDDTSVWVKKNFIISQFPEEVVDKIIFKESNSQSFTSEGEKYYIKFNDIIKKGENEPFSSVKSVINVIILNNKKTSLSKELTQEIYNEGLNEGWIKINIK